METREFDELKAIKQRHVPYEEYFGDMYLSEEQKKERITFSSKIEEMMLFIFSLISVMNQYGEMNTEYLLQRIKSMYRDIVSECIDIDEYIEQYIQDFSDRMIGTTIDNVENIYYISNDRAMFISENESNTILNYKDFLTAIALGKKKKEWIDVRDRKERKSHIDVGGKILPISEPFYVGDSFMQYPKDTSLGASPTEIVNCRCSITYF